MRRRRRRWSCNHDLFLFCTHPGSARRLAVLPQGKVPGLPPCRLLAVSAGGGCRCRLQGPPAVYPSADADQLAIGHHSRRRYWAARHLQARRPRPQPPTVVTTMKTIIGTWPNGSRGRARTPVRRTPGRPARARSPPVDASSRVPFLETCSSETNMCSDSCSSHRLFVDRRQLICDRLATVLEQIGIIFTALLLLEFHTHFPHHSA